ncbi:MAG TPA: hypothetical protein VFR78_11500 [Pyrinomonadaceae bacterium]|nr:hypothetical protein [Pyrinomonadaceae bacterium]
MVRSINLILWPNSSSQHFFNLVAGKRVGRDRKKQSDDFLVGHCQFEAVCFEKSFSDRSPDTFISVEEGMGLGQVKSVCCRTTHNIGGFIVVAIPGSGES